MFKLVLLLTILTFSVAANAQTIVLNSPLLKIHKTESIIRTIVLLEQAFDSLGYNVEFRYRPDKRSILEANSGQVDGDFLRILTIAEDYTNMIVVPEPLAEASIVAFSLQPNIDLSNYAIEEHQYNIGYIAGWKVIEDMLDNYQQTSPVAEVGTLFKLLTGRRVDLILYAQAAGKKILSGNEQLNYQVSSSLHSYELYLVMHKKHIDLVPKLAAKLKQLKKEYLANH